MSKSIVGENFAIAIKLELEIYLVVDIITVTLQIIEY